MKWSAQMIPMLLAASGLAVIGLVYFQWTWMKYSLNLSDEIFDQRVSMALCSALEKYDGNICSKTCDLTNEHSNKSCASQNGQFNKLVSDPVFSSELRRSLDFYQIQSSFLLEIRDSISKKEDGIYQCSVGLPVGSEYGDGFLRLEFPDKITFALSRMKMMLVSSVLILLFTITVLLTANWMLIRQKKLLQTSVDFFNNMAHEFRTPLSNIQLAVNLLIRKFDEFRNHALISVIKRESVNLLNQVESVLQLAKLENDDSFNEKEVIRLAELLSDVREEMSIRIEEQQAEVEIIGIPDDLEIFGDAPHLKNVFRNLLDNALKYCKEKPRILISAKKQSNGVIISVKDNGIGIPYAEKEVIFQKFRRVNQGNLHEYKGFGLGLAYVKNIVEKHNGFVRASSEGRNGSSFDVYLPIYTN